MVDDDAGTAATMLGAGTTATATPEVPTRIADRYTVLGLLGVGGMGRVYRVHDETLDEIVALKILRIELANTAELVERFRREVKLARRVTSPHVVRTFDLGQHGGDHYLTMELVDGRSLAQILEAETLPLAEVVRVGRAACAGIAAAHAAGVLHRDLKPDNILVAKSGRIAITDFGIARAADAGTTGDGFVGTPAYMAPEQVDGRAPIGPATDLYALGAILYEMLVGRRPFVGRDAMQVAVARLTAPPPDPRAVQAVPDAIAEIVVRCLAREPAGRFADAAELDRALAALDERALANARRAAPVPASVPARSSRAVALLPLRATGELAEVADGLTEEIIDALAMTRGLRVRPLSSVRVAWKPELDPCDVGRALGVEVVVDGTLRQVGEGVRVTARAIGVEDGFQLWANRIDTRLADLLSAGDGVAREVAHALAVELEVPVRRQVDPRATELYLEGKAKLRAGWVLGDLDAALAALAGAYALAPDDLHVIATYATAHARDGFYGAEGALVEARALGERAVAMAPESGEAWVALGAACMYGGAFADAARAQRRAVARSTGNLLAQAQLGALLLEADALPEALIHLEAARSLDPIGAHIHDLARAYMYDGRCAQAEALLSRDHWFDDLVLARFQMWQGTFELAPPATPQPNRTFRSPEASAMLFRLYTTHRPEITAEDRAGLLRLVEVPSTRLRSTRCQFVAEIFASAADHEAALGYVEWSVAAGLPDALWMRRCPMLAPLRAAPRFAELTAIVDARAREVRDAVRDAV